MLLLGFSASPEIPVPTQNGSCGLAECVLICMLLHYDGEFISHEVTI